MLHFLGICEHTHTHIYIYISCRPAYNVAMIWRHVSFYFPNSPSSSLRSEPARQNLALVFLRSANNRTRMPSIAILYSSISLPVGFFVFFLCFCLVDDAPAARHWTSSTVLYSFESNISINRRAGRHASIYFCTNISKIKSTALGCIPFQPNVVRGSV